MADDLDLDAGDEERAEAASSRAERRRRRQERSSTTSEKKERAPRKDDSNLRGALRDAFDKIAEQLEVRGDEELSTAVREESANMATGFDTLTRTLTPLRYPLVVLVALITPILAFWRVGGILFRRFMVRRQRRWEEAQREEQTVSDEYTPGYNPDPVVVP